MATSKNAAVGAFVVGGLLLFAFGLFMIGDRRQLFSKDFEIWTEFKELGGVQNGAKVKVGGMDAGEVLEIQVPAEPQAKFRVKVRVLERLHAVVRSDSVASIQTEGVLGNKFVKIDPGTPESPQAPPGSTIPSREPFDFADLLQEVRDTIGQVRGQMDDVFASVQDTSKQANDLIVAVRGDVEAIVESGKKITDDVSQVVEGVQAGRGIVGKLVKDEGLSESATRTMMSFERTAENVRESSGKITEFISDFQQRQIMREVEQTMKNLQQLTAQAREAIETFQGKDGNGEAVAAEIRRTMTDAREAMSDLADNMEALKHNWFVRGFFNRRGFYDVDNLTIAEYREGKFTRGKERQQIWLHKTELFAKNSRQKEELSEEGKKRLNEFAADFQRYPSNSLIMVEGYSAEGSKGDQSLASRERAMEVRDYLVKTFHFNPSYVGVMPMGALASKSPAGNTWDGVALVVFYDKNQLRNSQFP
jgi:phospholipid/cholesterol/gamma-HCH transport system substrate-binding protein